MNKIKKTIAAHTLGCKVNQYDTQAMLELFERAGYLVVDFSDIADVYLVNTCTVTAMADKKSRQLLRKAKARENSIVIAAGCFSQRIKAGVLEYCDVSIGNQDREKIVEIANEYLENKIKTNKNNNAKELTDEYERLFITKELKHTRAHMKIQEGCNNSCAYCIIPSVRGNIRSRTLDDIETEAKSLFLNNTKEVVLTGINLSSYGLDQKDQPSLYDVISIIEDCGIPRIRLGSIDPGTFIRTPEILDKTDVLCPHFHLSLQSGCTRTLNSMNRWYTRDEYRKEVEFIRYKLPNCAITTDVIVGFPGETEEDFIESYNFIKEIKFAKIHVFPFSTRPDTLAYTMPDQIAKHIKGKRVNKMLTLNNELEQSYMSSFIGKDIEVLIESKENDYYQGYSREYIKVITKSDIDIHNTIKSLNITNIKNKSLIGCFEFT